MTMILRTLFLLAGLMVLAEMDARAEFNVRLRSQLDPLDGVLRYGDVWGEGNYAYLATFNTPEPNTARGSGVLIIDISDPDNPQLAGHYLPATGARFQDVVVINGIGYFSSENNGGVHIVDVRNPSAPLLLSQITPAQNGYGFVHEIAVADGVLYEADSRTTTVKAFDVRNPSAPAFIRDIPTTDTIFIHAITAINGRLYTSGWSGRTDIFDVRNILSMPPTRLGTVFTGASSHSSWVSSDGSLLASARETANGDVRLFDISNPANPQLRSTITAQDLGISALTPHNPFLVGRLLFVSWYQAGLQILDISDPSRPRRVGEYDTYLDSAITGFRGCWGVYPYLGFDRVLLSDMDGGLLIVDTTQSITGPRTVSAASFDQNALASHSIAALFGEQLSETTKSAATVPLPLLLGDTSVSVRDSAGVERETPLFFVSPAQINYQIPPGTATGPAESIVKRNGIEIARGVFLVNRAAPGIFTVAQDGAGPAAALDALAFTAAPFAAQREDGSPNIIAVYCTGLGADATDTDIDDGMDAGMDVDARIDGQTAVVLYAGRAPGFSGLNQVNVSLTPGIAPGVHTLTLRLGDKTSNPVSLEIRF
jgi:uncharacterized protein (TIGR03437 family)